MTPMRALEWVAMGFAATYTAAVVLAVICEAFGG